MGILQTEDVPDLSAGLANSGELAVEERDLPADIAPADALVELAPCDADAVELLGSRLDLDPLVAQTLVRRGFDSLEAAERFLSGGEIREAAQLPGAREAAFAIAAHVRAGSRIAVHGDYDVDGVCSTAILVRTLARLGAEVTWHVPSRFGDGYGLSRAAVDKLADDDASLIVAVDCGITAVEEVAHARASGVDVVICDHHAPGEALPDAPIVHPGLADYPCPALCAAAVVYKLAELLAVELGQPATFVDSELELAALATVCDVVPLVDENRAIVRAGLTAMRTTQRPGLRELMRVADVDPLRLDASSFGFRLGPRINAAGRMFSAEPAVELLLTSDERRAVELANDLNGANARRKDVEQTVLFQAETQARRQRDHFAIVVSGEDWHPGVLGIVAGRIAEQYRRPCVALSVDGGVAAGSGRGGGVYDLLAGLTACKDHLIRFGGHKAAAGLELDESALSAFTRDFQAHAESVLTPDDLRPRVRADALATPSQLTLPAAEALLQLGPFGNSNPEPALMVPGVTVVHLRKMGASGRHFKLSVAGRGGRAGVVAFSWQQAIAHGDDAPVSNIVVKLRPNEFRGVVEGQSQLIAHAELPTATGQTALDGWHDAFQAAFASEPPHIAEGGTFALHAVRERAIERSHVVAAYRTIGDAGDGPLSELGIRLAEALPNGVQAGLAVRVLHELGLVGVERNNESVESLKVADAERTELERSATFRSYSEIKDQSQLWLAQSTPTPATPAPAAPAPATPAAPAGTAPLALT
ncbi:MAG: single-stranded-DNA-specific exonuclease RecJ [Actinobacteria bacterium]|nr:single-stranded-DNA-specific exonuclease RecJ [Actinomycetota bacterium]